MDVICYVCNKQSTGWHQNFTDLKSQYTNTSICVLIKSFLADFHSMRKIEDESNYICIECWQEINDFDWINQQTIEREAKLRFLLMATETKLKNTKNGSTAVENEVEDCHNKLPYTNGLENTLNDFEIEFNPNSDVGEINVQPQMEIEQPAKKSARLMKNDCANGGPWPTMIAKEADNVNENDSDEIETNTISANVMATKIFTDLSSELMEPIKHGLMHTVEKYIAELMDQNQIMEHNLKHSIKVQEDLQRNIVDYEGKLKRALDENAQANNKITELTKQLNGKGACGNCGKCYFTDVVYFCNAACSTAHFEHQLESHAEVHQKKDQMDTNSTE